MRASIFFDMHTEGCDRCISPIAVICPAGVCMKAGRGLLVTSLGNVSLSLSHSRCLSLEMGEGVCVLGSKNGSGTLRIVNCVLS